MGDRLLARLPWTLSVARQPVGCCGSGVQRSSGSPRREGCAPTHGPTHSTADGGAEKGEDRGVKETGQDRLL